jgi:hypothetical protein
VRTDDRMHEWISLLMLLVGSVDVSLMRDHAYFTFTSDDTRDNRVCS